MARAAGRLEEARSLYEESLAIERELGQARALAVLLANLGRTIVMSGDALAAAPHFREGLQLAREVKEWRLVSEALDEHASIALAQGRPEQAARLMGAAAKLKESVEAGMDRADRIFHEHVLAEVRSAAGEEAFTRLEAEGRAMKVDEAIALALGEG